jgi:hypothetical protein
MSEQQEQFLWGDLTERWWRESGASCRATETQIKYACSRHQGANKSKAAALAGYKGTPEALRSQGVRAEGTQAVDALLTLAAAAESGVDGEGPATAVEIDRKLAKLIRSPDGSISLKAIETYQRREEQRRQRGETPEDDGFFTWRLERDYACLPNGAAAYLMLIGGNIANLCLLHDTYHAVMLEEHGPELWQRFYARLNEPARTDLDRHMADPGWQLDARRKIWAELGMNPPGPIITGTTDMLRREPVAKSNGAEVSINAAP